MVIQIKEKYNTYEDVYETTEKGKRQRNIEKYYKNKDDLPPSFKKFVHEYTEKVKDTIWKEIKNERKGGKS